MARFDCWVNPISQDRDEFPFVLEIQSDLLHRFAERVVVPLAAPGAVPGMTDRFNPALRVGADTVRLHPLGIAVFHVRDLRESVGNLKAQAIEVETALDMLLRGY